MEKQKRTLTIEVNRVQPSFFNFDLNLHEGTWGLGFDYFSLADSSIHIIITAEGSKDSVIKLSDFLTRAKYSKGEIVGYSFIGGDSLLLNISGNDSIFVYSISKGRVNSALYPIRISNDSVNVPLQRFVKGNKPFKLGSGIALGCYAIYNDRENKNSPGFSPTLFVYEFSKTALVPKYPLGFLPHAYRNKDYYVKQSSKSKVNDTALALNYFYSDSIDIVTQNKNVKRVAMKSRFSSGSFAPFNSSYDNVSAISKYFDSSPRYTNLYYDSKNKFYLRTFMIADTLRSSEISFFKNWSLVVYDSQFNYRGEFVFESKKNDPSNMFVCSDGAILIVNENSGGKRKKLKLCYDVFFIKEK